MRVIAGSARGQQLRAKLPEKVRPTTDFAREAIFSMLEARGGLDGLIVCDLYCGSGALGIEALSRGAAHVFFYDSDPKCLAAAKENYESVNVEGEAHFIRATLPLWTPPDGVDLVIADPPYGPMDLAAIVHGLRASRVVVENDRFMEAPAGWGVTKEKRYGTTLVTILEPLEEESA